MWDLFDEFGDWFKKFFKILFLYIIFPILFWTWIFSMGGK